MNGRKSASTAVSLDNLNRYRHQLELCRWSHTDRRYRNYTVRVVDLAGNVGQTATQNVVVDTTSPEAAKSITITGISDDTGASSSDFITSDTTLTVRGVLGAALGANEFAQISTDNGATRVNVTVAADGLNWSYVDGRTLTNGTTTAGAGSRSCGQRWRNQQPVGADRHR